jgi:thiol-disulfide isomerase/thioredoxin
MRASSISFIAVSFLAGQSGLCAAGAHPILQAGSAAPDFALPGVDGRIHRLADFAASPVLAIVFACNHCPIAQQYEQRIERLYQDYRHLGVAVVAIQPNAPEALRLDELDSSDTGDTLEEMKIRVAFKHFTYPYLYDGETQAVAEAYGPQATPHVFVFDHDRRLRYEGRFDSSYRAELVKTQDARNAIDALLKNQPVDITHTPVFGCSTKWKEKEADKLAALRKLEEKPVTVEPVSVGELKVLRANAAHKLTLIHVWSTKCDSCMVQLDAMEDTYRMYSPRGLELVTVAVDPEQDAVRQVLLKQHATNRNLFFASQDIASLRPAFDPDWDATLPYTAVLAPDGRLVYRMPGRVDMLQLRRTILANIDWEYDGFSQYWTQK